MPLKEYSYQNLSLQSMKGERWKNVPGLEGYYVISNLGRVKRLEYEIKYEDGRCIIRKEKIIKPGIFRHYNKFTGDFTPFLRFSVSLSEKRYNFSVARLVYHCFIRSIDLNNFKTVILTKDGDNFNIRPSNLIAASLTQKHRRIFQRKRAISNFLNLPEATRQRQRQAITKKISRQITQYSLAGKKIKTFPSMVAAQRATGVFASSIRATAVGINMIAGGYIWRFGNAKTIDTKNIEIRRRKRREKLEQKVTQYDMQGRRIALFPSIKNAAETIGASESAISFQLKGSRAYKSVKGYFWKKGYGPARIDLSNYKWGKKAIAAGNSKKVKQYSLQGKYIQTFSSVTAAARHLGVSPSSLSCACNGRSLTCGGFKWQLYKR